MEPTESKVISFYIAKAEALKEYISNFLILLVCIKK